MLTAAFASQEAGFADVPRPATPAAAVAAPVSPAALITDPSLIDIPFDSASVREIHRGTNGKLIIHIQDAHANLSGQEHLAATLDHLLARYDIPLVLVEGSTADVSLSEARASLSPESWKRVAKRFLYDGVISGEEYLNLTSDHPMKLIGVEDPALYREDVEAYARLAATRDDSLEYLRASLNAVKALKNRLYPKSLLEYEALGAGDEGDITKKLEALGRLGGAPGGEWTEIARLGEIRAGEASIDFDRLNAEQEKLLAFLGSRGLGAALREYLQSFRRTSNPQIAQYLRLSKLLELATQNGADPGPSSEMRKYLGVLKGFAEFDFHKLFSEFGRYEEAIYRKELASDASALKLRAVDRFLGLLESALRIRMSSEEFAVYSENLASFETRGWQAFLNARLLDAGLADSVVPYRDLFENSHSGLERFYSLVGGRDRAFVSNARRVMQSEGRDAAFFIAGGYHTEHLTQLWREEGTSYIVLSPVIGESTDDRKYERLLLASRDTLRQTGAAEPPAVAGAAPPAAARFTEVYSKTSAPESDIRKGMTSLLSLASHHEAPASGARTTFTSGGSSDFEKMLTDVTSSPYFSGNPALHALEGHTNYVWSAHFSPDGKRIVSASRDKTLKIWNTDTGALLRTLEGHADNVMSAQFSPDGKHIVSASTDKTLKIWDSHTGELLRTLEGHAHNVMSAQFSPDGKRIVSASDDKSLKIWDSHTGELLRTLEGHTNYVLSVQFSPDGKRIVSASRDQTLKIWDAETGALLRTLEGHAYSVTSAHFSPDGKRIVSASRDNTLKIWNTDTGALLRTLEGHADNVMSAQFSPDGKHIASASYDKTLKIWDSHTGALLRTLERHADWVLSVHFSPNGKRIVSASRDQTLKIWDPGLEAEDELSAYLSPHLGDGETLHFALDQFIALGKAQSGLKRDDITGLIEMLRLMSDSFVKAQTPPAEVSERTHAAVVTYFENASGSRAAPAPGGSSDLEKMLATVTSSPHFRGETTLRTLKGHTDAVSSAQFSPDGAQIVSASGDRTLKIWDVATGAVLRTFEGHVDKVYSVRFSPDGKRIASASHDNSIKIWDVATGALVRTIEGHTASVLSAQFSPDGTQIVSTSNDKTIKIWNVATGYLLRTLEGHADSVRSAQFSPDGKQVASASFDNSIKIWDVATGALVRTIEGHTASVLSAQLSPDGTQIVSTSNDKTIKIWNVETGALIQTLTGHAGVVFSAQFSPDGQQVVSGSLDKTVKIWNAKTGVLFRTIEGSYLFVFIVQFSPDGNQIVFSSGDTLKIWDTGLDAEGELSAYLSPYLGDGETLRFALDQFIALGKAQSGLKRDDITGLIEMLRLMSDSFVKAQTPPAEASERTRAAVASYFENAAGSRAGSGSRGDSGLEKMLAAVTSPDFNGEWIVRDFAGEPALTLRGHTGRARSAQFSPSGRRIVSSSDDGTVKIWDSFTGKLLGTIHGNGFAVTSAQFSPDGEQIVTASADHTLKIRNASAGDLLRTLTGHSDAIHSAQFSPDGKQIVSASHDRTLKIWDSATGALLRTLQGHKNWVRSAQFSPDGKQIVSASDDGSAIIWLAATGDPIHVLRAHGTMFSAEFSPDGRRIVATSTYEVPAPSPFTLIRTISSPTTKHATVHIWDASTGELIRDLEERPHTLLSTQFSPSGRQIIAASEDGSIKMWNAETGELLVDGLKGHYMPVNTAQFSPTGRRIVSAANDGTVKIWNGGSDPEADAELGSFLSPYLSEPATVRLALNKFIQLRVIQEGKLQREDVTGLIEMLRLMNDGFTKAQTPPAEVAASMRAAVVSYFDNLSGSRATPAPVDASDFEKMLKKVTAAPYYPDESLVRTLTGHTDYVLDARFSPDGRLVASASRDNTVRIWDAATGQPLRTLSGHSKMVNGVAFSPDGTELASVSDESAGNIRIWNVSTGEVLRTFTGDQGDFYSVVFSPDGASLLVSGAGGNAQILDAKSGVVRRHLSALTQKVLDARFSPDGRYVASASNDKAIIIWDLKQMGKRSQLWKEHTNPVTTVQYSHDGKMLVSGSSDQTIKIWDTQSGRVIHTLKGHTNTVYDAQFSPDDSQIVSAGVDGTLRIWDVKTGEALRTLDDHVMWVESADYSPDGSLIVSAGSDKTVKIWSSTPDSEGALSTYLSPYLGDGELLDMTVRQIREASKARNGLKRDDILEFLEYLRLMQTGLAAIEDAPERQMLMRIAVLNYLAESFAGARTNPSSGSSSDFEKMFKDVTSSPYFRGNPVIRTLEGHADSVRSAQFSPDGKRIVSASGDNTLKIWDAATGALLRTLEGHTNYARSARFSPDGRQIISASYDNTLKIWAADTGFLLGTLEGHTDSVTSAQFSPDGKRIVSGSFDKTLKIWDPGLEAEGELSAYLSPYLGEGETLRFALDQFAALGKARNGLKRDDITSLIEMLRLMSDSFAKAQTPPAEVAARMRAAVATYFENASGARAIDMRKMFFQMVRLMQQKGYDKRPEYAFFMPVFEDAPGQIILTEDLSRVMPPAQRQTVFAIDAQDRIEISQRIIRSGYAWHTITYTLSSTGSTLTVYDGTNRKRDEYSSRHQGVRKLGLSPDGRMFAFVSEKRGFRLLPMSLETPSSAHRAQGKFGPDFIIPSSLPDHLYDPLTFVGIGDAKTADRLRITLVNDRGIVTPADAQAAKSRPAPIPSRPAAGPSAKRVFGVMPMPWDTTTLLRIADAYGTPKFSARDAFDWIRRAEPSMMDEAAAVLAWAAMMDNSAGWPLSVYRSLVKKEDPMTAAFLALASASNRSVGISMAAYERYAVREGNTRLGAAILAVAASDGISGQENWVSRLNDWPGLEKSQRKKLVQLPAPANELLVLAAALGIPEKSIPERYAAQSESDRESGRAALAIVQSAAGPAQSRSGARARRSDSDASKLVWHHIWSQKKSGEGAFGERYPEEFVRFAIEETRELENKRVIVAGDGDGVLTDTIAKEIPHAEIRAFDLTGESRRTRPSNVSFRESDFAKLPYEAGSADALVSAFTFEYTDIDRSVKEIRRVLKAGGKAVMILHKNDSVTAVALAKYRRELAETRGQRRALREAGEKMALKDLAAPGDWDEARRALRKNSEKLFEAEADSIGRCGLAAFGLADSLGAPGALERYREMIESLDELDAAERTFGNLMANLGRLRDTAHIDRYFSHAGFHADVHVLTHNSAAAAYGVVLRRVERAAPGARIATWLAAVVWDIFHRRDADERIRTVLRQVPSVRRSADGSEPEFLCVTIVNGEIQTRYLPEYRLEWFRRNLAVEDGDAYVIPYDELSRAGQKTVRALAGFPPKPFVTRADLHIDPVIWRQMTSLERRLAVEISDGRYGDLKLHDELLKKYPDKIYSDRRVSDTFDEGRSMYLILDKPVRVRGRELNELKFKGSMPRVDASGRIRRYYGAGFVGKPFDVLETGEFTKLSHGVELPRGTGLMWELKSEYDVMALYAAGDPEGDWMDNEVPTDYPVGWRMYDRFIFEGERTGVVITGVEGHDFRVRETEETGVEVEDSRDRKIYPMTDEERLDLARQIGRAFRAFHEKGRYHRYPHTGNIGVGFDGVRGRMRVLIRDLDSTRPLEGSPEERARKRFIDVERLSYEILRISPDMIGQFLEGYFYDSPGGITPGVIAREMEDPQYMGRLVQMLSAKNAAGWMTLPPDAKDIRSIMLDDTPEVLATYADDTTEILSNPFRAVMGALYAIERAKPDGAGVEKGPASGARVSGLLRKALLHKNKGAEEELLTAYGFETDGYEREIGANRRLKLFNVGTPKKPSWPQLTLTALDSDRVRLKFRKQDGFVWMRVEDAVTEKFLFDAFYSYKIRDFVRDANHMRYFLDDSEAAPFFDQTFDVNKNRTNMYYVTAIDGKSIYLPYGASKHFGIATDSRLETLKARFRKELNPDGKSEAYYLYAFLPGEESDNRNAVGKWKWNRKIPKFELVYFSIPGRGSWFAQVMAKKIPTRPYYGVFALNAGELIISDYLTLRLADMFRKNKIELPPKVLLASTPEPERVDVYETHPRDADRGVFDAGVWPGRRYIVSRFYVPGLDRMTRPWEEATRRYKKYLEGAKNSEPPDPVVLTLSKNIRGSGRVMRHPLQSDKPFVIGSQEFAGGQAILRFRSVGKGKRSKSFEVIALDDDWQPVRRLRAARALSDGSFEDVSLPKQLTLEEEDAIRQELRRLGYTYLTAQLPEAAEVAPDLKPMERFVSLYTEAERRLAAGLREEASDLLLEADVALDAERDRRLSQAEDLSALAMPFRKVAELKDKIEAAEPQSQNAVETDDADFDEDGAGARASYTKLQETLKDLRDEVDKRMGVGELQRKGEPLERVEGQLLNVYIHQIMGDLIDWEDPEGLHKYAGYVFGRVNDILAKMRKLKPGSEDRAWAEAVPDAEYWLAMQTTQNLLNRNHLFVLRGRHLAELSPKGSLWRFGFFGPHLRAGTTMAIDAGDFEMMPHLMKSFMQSEDFRSLMKALPSDPRYLEAKRAAMKLLSGLHFVPEYNLGDSIRADSINSDYLESSYAPGEAGRASEGRMALYRHLIDRWTARLEAPGVPFRAILADAFRLAGDEIDLDDPLNPFMLIQFEKYTYNQILTALEHNVDHPDRALAISDLIATPRNQPDARLAANALGLKKRRYLPRTQHILSQPFGVAYFRDLKAASAYLKAKAGQGAGSRSAVEAKLRALRTEVDEKLRTDHFYMKLAEHPLTDHIVHIMQDFLSQPDSDAVRGYMLEIFERLEPVLEEMRGFGLAEMDGAWALALPRPEQWLALSTTPRMFDSEDQYVEWLGKLAALSPEAALFRFSFFGSHLRAGTTMHVDRGDFKGMPLLMESFLASKKFQERMKAKPGDAAYFEAKRAAMQLLNGLLFVPESNAGRSIRTPMDPDIHRLGLYRGLLSGWTDQFEAKGIPWRALLADALRLAGPEIDLTDTRNPFLLIQFQYFTYNQIQSVMQYNLFHPENSLDAADLLSLPSDDPDAARQASLRAFFDFDSYLTSRQDAAFETAEGRQLVEDLGSVLAVLREVAGAERAGAPTGGARAGILRSLRKLRDEADARAGVGKMQDIPNLEPFRRDDQPLQSYIDQIMGDLIDHPDPAAIREFAADVLKRVNRALAAMRKLEPGSEERAWAVALPRAEHWLALQTTRSMFETYHDDFIVRGRHLAALSPEASLWRFAFFGPHLRVGTTMHIDRGDFEIMPDMSESFMKWPRFRELMKADEADADYPEAKAAAMSLLNGLLFVPESNLGGSVSDKSIEPAYLESTYAKADKHRASELRLAIYRNLLDAWAARFYAAGIPFNEILTDAFRLAGYEINLDSAANPFTLLQYEKITHEQIRVVVSHNARRPEKEFAISKLILSAHDEADEALKQNVRDFALQKYVKAQTYLYAQPDGVRYVKDLNQVLAMIRYKAAEKAPAPAAGARTVLSPTGRDLKVEAADAKILAAIEALQRRFDAGEVDRILRTDVAREAGFTKGYITKRLKENPALRAALLKAEITESEGKILRGLEKLKGQGEMTQKAIAQALKINPSLLSKAKRNPRVERALLYFVTPNAAQRVVDATERILAAGPAERAGSVSYTRLARESGVNRDWIVHLRETDDDVRDALDRLMLTPRERLRRSLFVQFSGFLDGSLDRIRFEAVLEGMGMSRSAFGQMPATQKTADDRLLLRVLLRLPAKFRERLRGWVEQIPSLAGPDGAVTASAIESILPIRDNAIGRADRGILRTSEERRVFAQFLQSWNEYGERPIEQLFRDVEKLGSISDRKEFEERSLILYERAVPLRVSSETAAKVSEIRAQKEEGFRAAELLAESTARLAARTRRGSGARVSLLPSGLKLAGWAADAKEVLSEPRFNARLAAVAADRSSPRGVSFAVESRDDVFVMALASESVAGGTEIAIQARSGEASTVRFARRLRAATEQGSGAENALRAPVEESMRALLAETGTRRLTHRLDDYAGDPAVFRETLRGLALLLQHLREKNSNLSVYARFTLGGERIDISADPNAAIAMQFLREFHYGADFTTGENSVTDLSDAELQDPDTASKLGAGGFTVSEPSVFDSGNAAVRNPITAFLIQLHLASPDPVEEGDPIVSLWRSASANPDLAPQDIARCQSSAGLAFARQNRARLSLKPLSSRLAESLARLFRSLTQTALSA